MSVKQQSIEEKMAKSIFYNLSVLKMAVKTTADFDESLSEVKLSTNFQNYLKIISKQIQMISRLCFQQ